MTRPEKNFPTRLSDRSVNEYTSCGKLGMWLQERQIHEGKRGCFAKAFSWANDEGVQIAVRGWCAGEGDCKFPTTSSSSSVVITYLGYGLAKAIGEYRAFWSKSSHTTHFPALITSLLVFYSDLGPPYHVIPRGPNVVSISVTKRGKNGRR
jgi:hypothetical protein